MNADVRSEGAQKHFDEMQSLAVLLGWDAVKSLVPVEISRVENALDDGDRHLNSIPLAVWGRAALGPDKHEGGSKCCCCDQRVPKRLVAHPRHGTDGPMLELFNRAHKGHSLSDGISVLKHVARVEALKLSNKSEAV